MKILHLNQTYGRGGGGGTEQSIPNLCTMLEAQGHQNIVLFSTALPNPPTAPGRKLVHLEKVCGKNSQLDKDKAAVAQVLEMAQAERVDLVHFHQVNNPLLVRTLTEHFPSVYFIHNHALTCPSGQRLYKTTWDECHLQPGWACLVNPYLKNCGSRRPVRIIKQLLNCFELRHEANFFTELLVDSEFMRQTLVDSGFLAERITVTATVTELPALSQREMAYPIVAPPTVLYVGQLTEAKGLELLIQAAAQVRTPCRFVIVGDGYVLPRIKRLAAQLGIAERLEFKGWVLKEDLGQYYQQAALLVVPSIYPEPFGLVGAEAMAYARPVVAFRRGGIIEWLNDGETGFVVEPADFKAMAARIDQLLTDAPLAERMGRAGRAYLESKFHPQTHFASILAAYQRAVSKSPAILV